MHLYIQIRFDLIRYAFFVNAYVIRILYFIFVNNRNYKILSLQMARGTGEYYIGLTMRHKR